MPPKRKKKANASSEPAYNSDLFVGPAAELRYTSAVVHRTVVQGHGLDVSGIYTEEFIEQKGWIKFLQTPQNAIVPLVREFYANAKPEGDNQKMTVRGKTISIHKTTINAFYGTPNVENDGYHTLLEEIEEDDSRLDGVLEFLGDSRPQWVLTSGKRTSFPQKYMLVPKRPLYHFICATILPTTHLSNVTVPRAVLLYAFEKGLTIDVGRVLQQSIEHSILQTHTGGLTHPHLITGLSLAAKVTTFPKEELLSPKKMMTKYMVATQSRPPGQSSSHPSTSGRQHRALKKRDEIGNM